VIEAGKESILSALCAQRLPVQRMLNSEHLAAIADDLLSDHVSGLYIAVGRVLIGTGFEVAPDGISGDETLEAFSEADARP